MSTTHKNSLGPFITLTFIYFIVGFLTTVNGQCQMPLRTAFLSDAGAMKNSLVTLISFFFFLGYLVSSPFGGKWIDKVGYKATQLRALFFMTAGLAMFFLSSLFTVMFPETILHVGSIHIPYGYFIFLIGSFLVGTAAAVTQVVVNPYIAGYDLHGTQPVQRMNIVCAINSFGTTIAPFFVTALIFGGRAMNLVEIKQLLLPFIVLTCLVGITTLWTMRLPIPDLPNTRLEDGETPTRTIWSFRHFTLGLVGIFFYVGAEVCIGSNINLYAHELGSNVSLFGINDLVFWGIDWGMPALLATIYWGSVMVGRIISSVIRKISPRVQLTFVTILALILLSLAVIYNNIWLIALVGLCHSVMWGCIFTLATAYLKEYTAKASGIFMTGVFGGAVFPVLQGIFADVTGSWRWTWLIVIFCELVILFYALVGYKVRKGDIA